MSIHTNTLPDPLDSARCALGWGLLAANTAVLGSAVAAAAGLGKGGDYGYSIGQLWTWLNLRILGVELDVRGLERRRSGQPYVVMVNHESIIDSWVLATALPFKPRYVVKQELRRVPIFGYASERVGHIFVERGRSESARASMAQAASRVRAGTSVLFFPEGTRSPDGRLGPFKTGGFRLALQAGVPILPISIQGSRELLPPGGWRYEAGVVRVIVGRPISTAELSSRDLEPLMETTRRAILGGLEEVSE